MCRLAVRYRMWFLKLMEFMLEKRRVNSASWDLGPNIRRMTHPCLSLRGMGITLRMLETRTWHSWSVKCLDILLFQQVMLPDHSSLVASQEEWSN